MRPPAFHVRLAARLPPRRFLVYSGPDSWVFVRIDRKGRILNRTAGWLGIVSRRIMELRSGVPSFAIDTLHPLFYLGRHSDNFIVCPDAVRLTVDGFDVQRPDELRRFRFASDNDRSIATLILDSRH